MYLDQDLESSRLVSNLHRRNPLRRTFFHFHNRETYPYSTKDNFDRCPVIYSKITIVLPCQTQCRAYNRSGTQHGILYRTYDWGIGNDFHSLSIFLPWSGFESYSTSHLLTQARTLSLTVPFWTTSKSCQGMYSLKNLSSVLIYLYRSWYSICKQLYRGLYLKNSFQTLLYALQNNSTLFLINNMSYTYTSQKWCSASLTFL